MNGMTTRQITALAAHSCHAKSMKCNM